MWYWAQQPYLPQALEPVQEAAQAAELSREVLPPPHKDVIYLYYYEGYSAAEISRILKKNGTLLLLYMSWLPFEDEIAGLETRIKNYHTEIEDLKAAVAAKKVEIQNAQTLIDKYTKQQDNVRNNREFDFLSKEIEYQTLEIQLCEKRINEYIAAQEAKSKEVAASEETLQDRQHILAEKKSELDEIVSETKQDEEKLREKAKKLENKVEPRLLAAFKRIRKNARNGLAVVYIQRDSCGGCFNRIPPQRQLDIKMRKKIIVCEYCGRIMIDPELAGVKEEH